MRVLGISAFYHDAAAALLEDGSILAAAQEERFTRKKHDANFPTNAIQFCLDDSGIGPDEVDFAVFYEKPFLKFERLIETYLAFAPSGYSSFSKAIPIWIKEKLFQRRLLTKHLSEMGGTQSWDTRMLFSEHHLSHAAAAFYPSPFENAVVLTMDGVGEWATTSIAIGSQNGLEVKKEIHFPHSVGLLYSAFTYYLGFKVNSGEYKVMGLAPYGEAKYFDRICKHLIDVKSDGSFRLNQRYFNYCAGLTMTNDRFASVFGQPRRQPESKLTQFHMDIAASIQAVTEFIVLKITRTLSDEYKIPNLCLAGGVALNCVANGKIHQDESFENIWVQPAAGDAGGAIGAAFAAFHLHKGQPRKLCDSYDGMKGSFLGPQYGDEYIQNYLTESGATFEVLSWSDLIDKTALALADDLAVGWMQGKMEFGPRALGGRSILGNPMSPSMQRNLNLKVKYRESFRPFAPSILRDDVADWFDFDSDSPYMLMVANIKKEKRIPMSPADQELFGMDKLNVERSTIPAVTHVDYSARIQTVRREENPKYYDLISKFKEITGCPVLVNTSFNIRGEPIVCSPEDAFRCFMGTELDVLVLGSCYLQKVRQPEGLRSDYRSKFELD